MKRMSDQPEDFMDLSDQALNDVEVMMESDVSVRALYNRLYYGLFYAAKAALLSEGVGAKTHRGTADRVFQVLYDEKELFEREEAILLQRLQQKRDQADYELEVNFELEEFRSDLEDVKSFADSARSIIS